MTFPHSTIGSMTISLVVVAGLSMLLWRLFTSNKKRKSAAALAATASAQPTTDTVNVKVEDMEDDILKMIRERTVQAPHASQLTSVVEEAVLPFRFTKASVYEADANRTAIRESNKRDRARVLARLFSPTRKVFGPNNSNNNTAPFVPPGPRGANVIIAIPEDQIHCRKLARSLYLLSTYYNLFILIDLTQRDGDYRTQSINMQNRIELLRGRSTMADEDMLLLPEEVLPSHRILGIHTTAGKIAFVRNFPRKPDFILDYDVHVKDALVRFGFTVLIYNINTASSTTHEERVKQSLDAETTLTQCISSLGRDLL